MPLNISKKETILVVDDEVSSRDSLLMILSPFYEVHTAADSKEALRCILANNIDLVTLDLNLAGHSSIDVIKQIKELRPEIEVFVITAYGSLKNAREANHCGAGGFISKPFNAADIIVAVAKSFEMRTFNLKIRSMAEKIKSLRSSRNDNADISSAS